jgi:protein-S-isoprenylcysteine O-methyltransferase Ste14
VMSTLPFHLAYFGGLALGTVILWRHSRRRDRAPVLEDRTTAVDRALTALSSLGMFGLPLLHVATPWLSWADYSLDTRALAPGTALFAAGLWLLLRSHSDLGRYWSAGLQIRRGQPVIYEGVYSAIRHPLYAGYWLWGLAQPWLLHNWVAGLAMLATFAPVYLYRVAREERMLLKSLPEYGVYADRTPRLVPRRRGRALTSGGNPGQGGRPPEPPA